MRLMIIGELGGHLSTAGKIAIDRGIKVEALATIDQALINLRSGKGADLILIDLSQELGKFISSLKIERIHVPVVACGAEGTPATRAKKAIDDGAQEFITLPPDPDLIAALLASVSADEIHFIYQDDCMKQVLENAKRFSHSEASVLISGPSGTGKEVMARFVHSNSSRKDGPYIAINCAAIPENLLESELFGHEKGAFSGAIARRVGKFEEANGGTLLLDEISEMDVRLQAKLLRAIQEREIDRVGGSMPVKVDVRIIATSNRDMDEAIAKGDFRADLFYRLNVVNILLPALCDRGEDVRLLSDHFVEKYTNTNKLPPRKLTEPAYQALLTHNWPGNVRELENTIHRAVLLAQGNSIDEDAILINAPSRYANDRAKTFRARSMEEAEREVVVDTMRHCLGNESQAANILGISLRLMQEKLQKYGQPHAVT